MSATEYDPSGKSNLPFQVGAEIFNLLLLYADLMIFMCNRYEDNDDTG